METNNNMPLSLRIGLLKRKINMAIEESSLEPCVLESILRNIYYEIQSCSQQQYHYDLNVYQKDIEYESKKEQENSSHERIEGNDYSDEQ